MTQITGIPVTRPEWDRFESKPTQVIRLHVHATCLRNHVPPGSKVLEIGAGPGRFTERLAAMGYLSMNWEAELEEARQDADRWEWLLDLEVTAATDFAGRLLDRSGDSQRRDFMRKIFPRSVIGFLVVVMACGSGAAEEAEAPPVESRFEAGQVWSYVHREGEEQSRVYVAKVERLADTATVVHIQIVRVAVASRFQPSGIQDFIPHAAIGEEALEASVLELKDEVISPVGFADAYGAWHQTVEAGDASYFTTSVAEIVDLVERTIN